MKKYYFYVYQCNETLLSDEKQSAETLTCDFCSDCKAKEIKSFVSLDEALAYILSEYGMWKVKSLGYEVEIIKATFKKLQ